MVHGVLARAVSLFDLLETRWQGAPMQRRIGNTLVAAFLAALVVIQLNRSHLLPHGLSALLPTNHFYAVDLAFTLLLYFEVITLVFSLAKSVSVSVGKQFEILSLILLRQSFKELTVFAEPVEWGEVRRSILHMGAEAGGALAIFVVLGLYYRLQKHAPITPDHHDRESFVAAKKLIALLLIASFLAIGIADLRLAVDGRLAYPFFEVFYTVLIFSDILIVLLSLRYSSTYRIVFRNSGFAAATVFMRLALTAPQYTDAALGLAAVVFAVGLTLAYNAFGEWFAHPSKTTGP